MSNSDGIDWALIREKLLAEEAASSTLPDVKLPSLPRALIDFRDKAQEPGVKIDELGLIISSDAGLSAELLRTVNSSLYGLSAKVTSVNKALLLFGVRKTLLQLTINSMKQMMKSSATKLMNLQRFWNTNLERSLFAKEIAKLLGADEDVAFTAGMLQDFLLPLISNQEFDSYLEFLEDKEYESVDLANFERSKFGWDHAQAAAQIMLAWNFPDDLICCVYLHHRPESVLQNELLAKTTVAAVAVASFLPDPMHQTKDGIERLIDLEKTWPDFDLVETAKKVNEDFLEMSGGENNHFSLLRRLHKQLKKAEI